MSDEGIMMMEEQQEDAYKFEKASNQEGDSDEDSDNSGHSSLMNLSEAYSSDNDEMKELPVALKELFENHRLEASMNLHSKKISDSIFTKNKVRQVDSSNIQDERLRKANEVFEKKCVFTNIDLTAKQIKPMNSAKLDQAARRI
jgi:endo-alpha-1,4-polygalactosaminidase (GH114 family)